MVAPAVYSESQFADYLWSQLGQVGDVLGWDAGSVPVIEAVNDAMLDAEVATIGNAADIRELRALGRRAIWRAVVQATTGNYAFSQGDQTFNRQQVNAQAREMLKLAEAECQLLGAGIVGDIVTISRVTRPYDPYSVLPDEERVP